MIQHFLFGLTLHWPGVWILDTFVTLGYFVIGLDGAIVLHAKRHTPRECPSLAPAGSAWAKSSACRLTDRRVMELTLCNCGSIDFSRHRAEQKEPNA